MKEAAGEANLTVVAIILIAVIVAIATPLVTSMMKTSTYRTCCVDAGGTWQNKHCRATSAKTIPEREAVFRAGDSCVNNAIGRTDFNLYWDPSMPNEVKK